MLCHCFVKSEICFAGLGLGSAFPGATQLSSRSFGPVPGYAGHALHAPSLGENHFGNLSAQSAYKPLPMGQATFTDPYTGLRLQQSSTNVSKSMFQQDSTTSKDISSYATTVPQNNSIDVSQKAWGLSNFVTPNHSLYSHAADLSGLDYTSSVSLTSQPALNPPPAHSSKPAPLVQRNMYSSADMFLSRSTKSPPSHSLFDHRSQTATPVTSPQSLFSFSPSNTYPGKSEISLYNSDSMNYEAVSPATPETNSQGNDSYSSLQDLASISSTQQKLDVNVHQKQVPEQQIKSHQSQNQKSVQRTVRHEIYSGQNTQIGQMKQSPLPSPINMGGSPQMQIGSPTAPIPSSTVVQAPPPVQAPADSTTKPKKGRGRKKKEPLISELKTETSAQNYSPQTFTSSPDLPPRGNGSDFLNSQQQSFVQPNRSHHQMHSSASMVDQGHSSSPLMTSMNQSYSKNQNQSVYIKNENQSGVVNPVQQMGTQSNLVGLQSSPSTSQSSMSYSISGALEMSREAVFPNQEVLQGFNSNEMPNYGLQESFTSQLVERPMEGVVRQDMYNGQEDNVYNVTNAYGGQFVSPNSVLNMDLGNGQGNQSTIDEAAFSSLMDDAYRDTNQDKRFKGNTSDNKMPYIPLTATIEAENDDDLSHLAGPVVDKKDSKTAQSPGNINPPPSNPRAELRNASGGGSFMDSFMSFLQGKKPETLSSMSSAIIHNKPQLPKYIPEPRRPRPAQTEESAKRSSESQSSSLANSDMGFSDDDDDEFKSNTNAVVQNAISNLTNENESVKLSTNKSGGLTLKINLSKVKKAEEEAKNKAKAKKSPKSVKKGKEKARPAFGLKETAKPKFTPEDEENNMLPLRQLSARKAKENKGNCFNVDYVDM